MKKIAIFLDYDGTLVPFKPKPGQAKPSPSLVGLVKRISLQKNCFVTIISGRSMPELEQFFPVRTISLAALHGIQVRFSTGREFLFKKALEAKPLIEGIDSASKKKFASVKGILFQNKGYGFTLHFRNVQEKAHPKLKKSFKELVRKLDKRDKLEIIPGALVLEARPKGWDKGRTVKMILKRQGFRAKDPVFYFGDDFTDEDAFKALAPNAFTFLVSEKRRRTAARFWLKDPNEVRCFLQCFL